MTATYISVKEELAPGAPGEEPSPSAFVERYLDLTPVFRASVTDVAAGVVEFFSKG
jgi:hypothetical protein